MSSVRRISFPLSCAPVPVSDISKSVCCKPKFIFWLTVWVGAEVSRWTHLALILTLSNNFIINKNDILIFICLAPVFSSRSIWNLSHQEWSTVYWASSSFNTMNHNTVISVSGLISQRHLTNLRLLSKFVNRSLFFRCQYGLLRKIFFFLMS